MDAGAKKAPAVMLLGGVGAGKSYSIRTLLSAGLEVFVLQTEPTEVLDDLRSNPMFHACYIPPTPADLKAMIDMAKKVNSLSFESLTKVTDTNRGKYQQWIKVLETCNDFVDHRGQHYGDVTSWAVDRAFVIDSLTGLSKMAMDMVVGGRPTKSMSDWGVAMDQIERFIDALTGSCNCFFVLTGHLEPERDEETGQILLMPSTLGKKLPAKLPRFFSDVIHAQRVGKDFFWSTATRNVDTKARNLPISDRLAPDFRQIAETWVKRPFLILTQPSFLENQMFDIDNFLNQSTDKANATTVPPIPEDEYTERSRSSTRGRTPTGRW